MASAIYNWRTFEWEPIYKLTSPAPQKEEVISTWRPTSKEEKEFSLIYSNGKRRWSSNEDSLVLSKLVPDIELAAKIKRSVYAIEQRRWMLKNKLV